MTLAAPPAWSPCSPGLPGPRAPHPCGFPGPAQGFACPGKEETKTLCCLPSTPAAPSAPSSVKFSELTTTSVNVSWEAPQFPNGVLEGYRLVYEPCTPVDGEWGPQHGSLNTPCRGSLRRAPLHRHCSPWGQCLPAYKWETEAGPVGGTGSKVKQQVGGKAEEQPKCPNPRREFSNLFFPVCWWLSGDRKRSL